MDQVQKTPKQCSVHQQEIIAVDMSALSENEPRFLCMFCLPSSNKSHKIRSVRDAENDLQIIKTFFLQSKQEQSRTNLETLKDIESSIQQLKGYYISRFDKISENLKQHQTQIVQEQQQLIIRIQSVDLEQYFSMQKQLTNQYAEMKNIIEKEINELKIYDKIDSCIQLLSQIDDQIITLAPEQQLACQQKNEKQQISTPSLRIACETHQLEIICFDLTEQKSKEHRIACAVCAFNKEGQYIDLLNAQKQWQDYEKQKIEIIKCQFQNERNKIETAQIQLNQVLNKYQLKINEVNNQLAKNLMSIQEKNQKEFNKLDRDWLALSRKEIIRIADTLSKRQNSENKCKDYFHKQQKEVNCLIDDTLKFLIIELQQCNQIISLTRYQGTNKKTLDAAKQIYFNFKQIELQVSPTIFTIDCQKKIKLFQHAANQNQIETLTQCDQCICESFFGGNKKNVYQIQQIEFNKQMDKIQFDLTASTSFSEYLQQSLIKFHEEKEKEIKFYSDKIDELNDQLQISNKTSKQLKLSLESLQADNQQSQKLFQDKLIEFQQERNVSLKQIESLKKQNIEQENNLQDKQTIIEQLNDWLQELDREDLQIQIKKLQESLQKQKQEFKDEQKLNSQNLSKKDELILAKEKQIDQLKFRVEHLEATKDFDAVINQSRIDELNKQIQQHQQQYFCIQITQISNQLQFLSNQKQQNNQINMIQDQCNLGKDQQIIVLKQEIISLKNDQEIRITEINNLKINLGKITKELEVYQATENQSKLKEISDSQQIQSLKETIQEYGEIIDEVIGNLNDRPYEMINEYTKKQLDVCRSIAFNKESTIMVAGCGENKISVFQFVLGKLIQQQILSDHTSNNYILTLYFMRQSNQFISGSSKEIGIWSYSNQTKQYYCSQMLKQAHSNLVKRVIMNKQENLIISCSSDKTIKFWIIRKNQWECLQTLTSHTGTVWSICLNQSSTQLVSCGQDKQIIISQLNADQKWSVEQIIKVDIDGVRTCFINDKMIAFQPWKGTKLAIYKRDSLRKEFVKQQEIPVTCDASCTDLFPMIFNRRKQLLVNKNGWKINFLSIKKNNFLVEQQICFGAEDIYGAMTDDFEYLVTWDAQSKEFQVRKQK